MNISDTPKHKGLRKKMVETLREKGIADERVLQAMLAVPRHVFFDDTLLEHAYEDKAFPIGQGQTISQPYTVAVQTLLSDVKPKHIVLEVGTGSGYQACILAELGAWVLTVERQKALYQKAVTFFNAMPYKTIKAFYADGNNGLPDFSPFDRIVVTAGAKEIPEKLLEQLKPGGKMVIPVGHRHIKKMRVVEKDLDGTIVASRHGNFSFVPLLKGKVR